MPWTGRALLLRSPSAVDTSSTTGHSPGCVEGRKKGLVHGNFMCRAMYNMSALTPVSCGQLLLGEGSSWPSLAGQPYFFPWRKGEGRQGGKVSLARYSCHADYATIT